MKLFNILTLVAFTAGLGLADQSAKLNQPAPEFALNNAMGEKISLIDNKGKWVVLEWVNYDCPFVKKHYESGNMQNLQMTYRGKDVVWLSINSSAKGKQGNFEGKALLERIEKEKASADNYLIDEDGSVGKTYGAKTTPHMFVINPEGELVYVGAIDDKKSTDPEDIKTSVNYVTQALDAALAGKAIPKSATQSYGCSVKYK